MATLFMVRHGQASFLEANYDRLSPLGIAQARRLGAYWAQKGTHFDRVATGPCERQRDTAAAVVEALQGAGLEASEPALYPEFDEYPGQEIMAAALPALLEHDARVRDLHAVYAGATSAPERRAAFQKVYERVMSGWARGVHDLPQLESWQGFCGRVNAGLDRLIDSSRGADRVALFTSGGCIAVAMQRALGLGAEITLQTSYMSRNSSWSEFLFSGSRFTLSSFNSFAHLDDPAMLTYR